MIHRIQYIVHNSMLRDMATISPIYTLTHPHIKKLNKLFTWKIKLEFGDEIYILVVVNL